MKVRRVRLKVQGDILTVSLHPSYLHLRMTRKGHQFFIHEIYIPRSVVIPLLRWLSRSLRQVPAEKNFYPPLATRQYLKGIELLESRQRQATKLDRQRQRKRWLAAKRRAARKKRAAH